jgi:hypothetical protein
LLWFKARPEHPFLKSEQTLAIVAVWRLCNALAQQTKRARFVFPDNDIARAGGCSRLRISKRWFSIERRVDGGVQAGRIDRRGWNLAVIYKENWRAINPE